MKGYEKMFSILDTPIFGLVISVICFEIGLVLSKKTNFPLFNPLLVAMVMIVGIMLAFNIPLEKYELGGDMIKFFLSPITVILAVPLYKQIKEFKKYMMPIMVGISIGVCTSLVAVLMLSKITGISEELTLSLIPKSITTPMGIALSDTINGISGITVVAVILTGICGAVISPIIFRILRITHPVAKGIGLGTSAHAVGTSKAIEMGEVEGAMSGVSIGIAGILTVVLVPILLNLFSFIM